MSAGIERAIQALSGLDDSDRQWILGQLGAEERERLLRALSQNPGQDAKLGAADSQAAVTHGQEPVPKAQEQSLMAASLTSRQRLQRAEPQAVHLVLHEEPDWMVAAVCGFGQWPWLETFLNQLGPDRAERVKRYMRTQPDQGDAVQAALIEAVTRRMTQGRVGGASALTAEDSTRVSQVRSRSPFSLSRLTSWLM